MAARTASGSPTAAIVPSIEPSAVAHEPRASAV
jgi:hypothetical protein